MSSSPQSADKKYYGSKKSSAIEQTVFDARVRKAPVTPVLPRTEDRRADKYYENPKPIKAPVPAPSAPTPAAKAAPQRNFAITAATDVRPVLDRALNALHDDGLPRIVVVVANDELMRRARAALELMVARAEVTEDHARGIVFGYPISVPPVPAETKPAASDFAGDPLEFLAAAETPEEAADAALAAPVPSIEVSEEDFLAPPAPLEDEEVATPEPVSHLSPAQLAAELEEQEYAHAAPPPVTLSPPVPAQAPTVPTAPGRRSGRGTS